MVWKVHDDERGHGRDRDGGDGDHGGHDYVRTLKFSLFFLLFRGLMLDVLIHATVLSTP